MRKRRHCIVPILAWLIAMLPLGAHAAFFCVDSVASLQAALNTAVSNGQNDQIDIVAGNYTVVPGGFFYVSNEANSLSISGGFTASCAQLTTAHTTLNGGGMYQVMRIMIGSSSTAASVNIERITFIDGKTNNEAGVGLEISALNGDVRVEHSRFLLNHSTDSNGALYVETGGILSVRNSLFFANDAFDVSAAMLLTSNSVAYIVGNTVVGNSIHSTLPMIPIGGVYFAGELGTHLWLSNNIFWNNNPTGTIDFATSSVFTARSNDIGTMAGNPPDPQSQDNQSVDPQFAPCGSLLCLGFNLLRSSPLVDAGFDAAPGGLGSVDIEDKPRKIGPHVDIGAFEQDRIFLSGFDSLL